MSNKEQVIKHLEMIQGVVNRLAYNSFLIKGWSMTILAAALLFITKIQDQQNYIILSFLFPIVGFWLLDGYFLWQERLFRGVYNDVRKQSETDFGMNIPAQMKKPKCKWYQATLSVTLLVFYLMEIGFIFLSFFILNHIC